MYNVQHVQRALDLAGSLLHLLLQILGNFCTNGILYLGPFEIELHILYYLIT